jgi:phage shock protein C
MLLMTRRLYRSRTDTVLGGVAAGVANYLNTDPALVRIAWAILDPLTGGVALFAYIVAWIAVPEEPRPMTTAAGMPGVPPPDGGGATVDGEPVATNWSAPIEERHRDGGRAGIVVGLGLVLLGLWFLAREYLPSFDWGLIWPIVIVGIGVLILVNASRRT